MANSDRDTNHREDRRFVARAPAAGAVILARSLRKSGHTGCEMPLPIAEGLLFLTLGARAEDVAVAPRTVKATGRQTAIVTVPAFGRYAILAHSSQGTAVQLVDRMAGPGASDGVPGARDGRVDAFLDRGRTQVVLTSDAAGTGDVRVEAKPFVEIAAAEELLPDRRIVTGRLGDLEQRTFWVQVDDARDLAVEMAGRSLADVRVWRDGGWLVDAATQCAEVTPARGQPLTDCKLATRLEAGLYAVVAYGGPARAWSDPSDVSPLYVRSGFPALASAGRSGHVVSPFGSDRYLVPSGPDTFALELPRAAPASVAVGDFDASNPFGGWASSASLDKDARTPLATLHTGGRSSLVTVTGDAGQAYTLTWFDAAGPSVGLTEGTAFVSTIAAGSPDDRIDATGFVVEGDERLPAVTSLASVGLNGGWHRRFNIDDRPVTLDVDVREAATYVIEAGEASFRVEPVGLSRSPNYHPPDWRSGTATYDLSPGTYEVSLKGAPSIADVAIYVAGGARPPVGVPVGALQFPELTSGRSAVLYARVGVPMGIIDRHLPVALEDALPIALRPGEVVEVQSQVGSNGRIAAVQEDGSAAEVAVDGGPFAAFIDVTSGVHRVAVRQTSTKAQVVSVGFTTAGDLVDAPLPRLPSGVLDALPVFPPLLSAKPAYLDLPTAGTATYAMRVDKPGLYGVTTTGLLATRGAIRTRTVIGFASAGENGVGRNFTVDRYLAAGDYQVTVGADGQSAGHLALRLDARPVRDGGLLEEGNPARIALAAGAGAIYTFHVAEAGNYTVRTFGPAGAFRARLEDHDGWPLEAPDGPADVSRWLEPGDYRWMLLPEDTPSRRITTLERSEDVVATVGHGPFPVAVDRDNPHTWRESADGAPRAPDVWTFDLTAPTGVTMSVDGEMMGAVTAADGTEVGRLVVGRPFDEWLAAGKYTVALVNARRNDAVPYALHVATDALVPGSNRTIAVPGRVDVSIGAGGPIEIGSFGAIDVRAELRDDSGALVGASDDRPDDWNFLLFDRLKPGAYSLSVLPVGDGGSTKVFVRAPVEKASGTLALGASIALKPDEATWIYDVAPPAEGVLVVSASSTENVAVGLEAEVDGVFRTVADAQGASVLVPAGLERDATAWRVRVRSLDHRGGTVSLRADVIVDRVSEGSLANGSAVSPLAKGLGYGGWSVDAAPGILDVHGPDGVFVCTPDCRPADGPVPVDGRVGFVGPAKAKISAKRLVLADTSPQLALRGPATLDLAPHDGPVAVIVDGRTPGGVRIGGSAATAFGERGAVAVSLDGKRDRTAVLWPAVGASVDVRAARKTFAAAAPVPIPLDRTEATLAVGKVVVYDLPAGPIDGRLTLGKGLVAVLSGDGPERALWADTAATTYVLDGLPTRLTLLSLADEAVPYAVEVSPDDGRTASVPVGEAFERRVGGETLILDVPDVGGTLHVLGARSAQLVGDDGTLRIGDVFPVHGAGRLVVDTAPGALLVWLERTGEGSVALFGPTAGGAQPVTTPARVRLAGPSTGIALTPAQTGMLTIRVPGPVVAEVRRANGTAQTVLSLDGAPIHLALPAGAVQVWLRGVLGPLSGTADVGFTPATPISEGLGPEIAMGPGDARLFAITVPTDGSVGLGLRADAERVSAVLYDAAGAEVARGAAMMPRLTAGTWLLSLQVGEDARPVRVRPAVVGVTKPGDGPPDDVILTYLTK